MPVFSSPASFVHDSQSVRDRNVEPKRFVSYTFDHESNERCQTGENWRENRWFRFDESNLARRQIPTDYNRTEGRIVRVRKALTRASQILYSGVSYNLSHLPLVFFFPLLHVQHARTKKFVSDYRLVNGEESSPETDDNWRGRRMDRHRITPISSGTRRRAVVWLSVVCDRLSRCIGIN